MAALNETTADAKCCMPTEASPFFPTETFGRLQGASRTIYNDESGRKMVYPHRSGMEAWSVTITTSVLSFHISWFKVSIREGGWRGTDQYKITELQLLEITCCKRTAGSSQ
jgi:hypothetical protein